MTGVQLLAYLKRRLAEANLTVEADRDAELYDCLTEGRDELLQSFALCAPVVVRQIVAMVVDDTNSHIYNLPDDTRDPLRVIELREKTTREPYSPAAQLDQDNGEYEWISPRSVRFAENADPGDGIEVVLVPHGADIDADSDEADIGLPTPCHRAIGKYAAMLALTADEESDAKVAMGLYERELEKLERLYGDFDMNGGLALREAFMGSLGAQYGNTLY